MHEESIKNLLNRFRVNRSMSDEDVETTIRDILWNIDMIMKLRNADKE